MGQALRKSKTSSTKRARTRPTAVAKVKFYVPSTWTRFIARSIDSFLVVIPMVFFAYVGGMNGMADLRSTRVTFNWTLLVLFFLSWFSYQVLFLKLKARTPGKMLMGLYVTSMKSHLARLSWSQAIIRTACESFSIVLSMIPQAVALFRDDRRHVYDLIAKTQVMQDRPRKTEAGPRLILGTLIMVYLILNMVHKYNQMANTMKIDSNGLTLQIDSRLTGDRI